MSTSNKPATLTSMDGTSLPFMPVAPAVILHRYIRGGRDPGAETETLKLSNDSTSSQICESQIRASGATSGAKTKSSAALCVALLSSLFRSGTC